MTESAMRKDSSVRSAANVPGQYLTFVLGGEAYAIGILAIKEIIEHGQTTRVPMMPEYIRGVINLRGAVVPVIDLGVRFGTGVTVVTRRTCIVIVEVENDEGTQDVGILVDAVNEVMEIAGSDIEPAPAFGTRLRTDFIAGMGRIDGRFVVILDPARVLSVGEMAVLASVAASQSAPGAANDPQSREGGERRVA